MAVGTSIVLIAVGAILRFAVTWSATGFSVGTVGLILMIVGALGLVLGLTMLGPWSRRARTSHTVVSRTAGRPTSVTEETVEQDMPPVGRL